MLILAVSYRGIKNGGTIFGGAPIRSRRDDGNSRRHYNTANQEQKIPDCESGKGGQPCCAVLC